MTSNYVKPNVSQEAFEFAHSERERLIAALKASRAGTWRWNIAEDIVEWDDALCEVYGMPTTKAPKTSEEFLALIHPDDRDLAWRNVSRCIETGEVPIISSERLSTAPFAGSTIEVPSLETLMEVSLT